MEESSETTDANLRAIAQVVGSAATYPWITLDPIWQDQIRRAVVPHSAIIGVSPATSAELEAVVTYASHHVWQMLPCGAGSKLTWGGLVGRRDEGRDEGGGRRDEGRDEGGGRRDETAVKKNIPLIVISTERLNRLIDHAVGDLTVTVEAGMRFAKLQATLAKTGQCLGIDPAFPDQATIGGIVATADTGSLRHRYNSVRDMLLGLSFVRADGQLVKAGGRVVKNVAGYDLMKLLTGSYGTLGILTQMTLRVYPIPEASQTVVLAGEAGAIAQAAATLLHSALTPASVDILSAQALALLELPTAQGIGLAIRFQSIQASVQQQIERTLELAQSLGLTNFSDPNLDNALWTALREHMTAANQPTAITCKIGVRPATAVSVLQQIEQILPEVPWYGQIHAASGLGRLVCLNPDLPSAQVLEVRSLCQRNGGFLSILQAPLSLKQQIDIWGYPGNALELMQKLKHQFDPTACLSPHRFVGGI